MPAKLSKTGLARANLCWAAFRRPDSWPRQSKVVAFCKFGFFANGSSLQGGWVNFCALQAWVLQTNMLVVWTIWRDPARRQLSQWKITCLVKVQTHLSNPDQEFACSTNLDFSYMLSRRTNRSFEPLIAWMDWFFEWNVDRKKISEGFKYVI